MNPIRYLAYFFPYPARMAYWSYKSPFFSKKIALFEDSENSPNFTTEIKEAVLNKSFNKLKKCSIVVQEEIQDFEEKLCLILTLWLLGVVLFEVVKPSMIRIIVTSYAPVMVSLLDIVLLTINVLVIVALLEFFKTTYTGLFIRELHLFYIEQEIQHRKQSLN